MADYREIGAFQVNGQWATQIAYEASVRAGRVSEVALTFMNRRRQVAAFQGDREQVLSILGERNLAAIESGAGARDDKVRGRLGGATLHYRAVVLPHAASGQTQEAQPATPRKTPSSATVCTGEVSAASYLRLPSALQARRLPPLRRRPRAIYPGTLPRPHRGPMPFPRNWSGGSSGSRTGSISPTARSPLSTAARGSPPKPKTSRSSAAWCALRRPVAGRRCG